MDEDIKTTEDRSWEYEQGSGGTLKKMRKRRPEDDVAEVKRHLDGNCEMAWEEYSQEAPSVDEFNSRDFGKEPISDAEPEIYTLNSQLTPEVNDKILQEFQYAAQVAKVKPIESHPCMEDSYGENAKCPILNNPDEILVKIQEVFHPEHVAMEEEDGISDKHFILSYIQAKMPKRKLGWKDGCLHIDEARTNVTYQSIAASIMKKLRKVFG